MSFQQSWQQFCVTFIEHNNKSPEQLAGLMAPQEVQPLHTPAALAATCPRDEQAKQEEERLQREQAAEQEAGGLQCEQAKQEEE
eukprot:6470329-Amphidinium_carterae.2